MFDWVLNRLQVKFSIFPKTEANFKKDLGLVHSNKHYKLTIKDTAEVGKYQSLDGHDVYLTLNESDPIFITSFLTNVPILYPLKTPKKIWFSCVLRGE